MASKRNRGKHKKLRNPSYELPKPRTPLSCENCGEHIQCTNAEMLKAFMDHKCREYT